MDFRIRGICTSKHMAKKTLAKIIEIVGNKYDKRWDTIVHYGHRMNSEFLIKPDYHEFNIAFSGDIYKHTDIILNNLDEQIAFELAILLARNTVNYSVLETY